MQAKKFTRYHFLSFNIKFIIPRICFLIFYIRRFRNFMDFLDHSADSPRTLPTGSATFRTGVSALVSCWYRSFGVSGFRGFGSVVWFRSFGQHRSLAGRLRVDGRGLSGLRLIRVALRPPLSACQVHEGAAAELELDPPTSARVTAAAR